MKEKKNMSKLDIKVDPYSMELYEIAKEKKALAKREKDLKAKRKSEVHMTKWKALSELKRKFEKELKDSGHSYGVTLAKLAQMEEYYEYQNPKNTKQKSSSDDVEWVKEYIKKNDVASLIEKARATRYQTYLRTMKKKNTSGPKSGGKKNGDSTVGGQHGRGKSGGISL